MYRFKKDLHWYLRALEEIIILTLQDYYIEAYRVEGFTGVWTKEKGEEKKIAAIGIRVKKWVTLHGAAFNFDVTLSHFQGIIPCNIPDKGVTNFASLANQTVCIQEIKNILKKNFCKTFNTLFV